MKVLSFQQEFVRQNSERIQIIRYMRDAIGVEKVQWSNLTLSNLCSSEFAIQMLRVGDLQSPPRIIVC